MIQKKLGLTAIILFVAITVAAQTQDKIEYNQVYDCGEGKAKFKVLSCEGTGKYDKCKTFNINDFGGFTRDVYREVIENYNIKLEGCKTKNSPVVRNETEENDTTVSKNDETPAKKQTDGVVACFASSEDSDGKTTNDKTFRGVIRRLWEKEAKEGSDGGVTLTFQKMTIGAPRRWRPTLTDAYSQADPKKLIYPVRASFETCTDYRKAISKRKMERIYDCFVHKTGGWQCTQTGASGALATKDKEEYIQKQQ